MNKTTPQFPLSPRPAIRLLRLALGLLVIWLVVFVLAPLPFEHSAFLRRLKETAEAYGIHPGSVYYTDVPTSGPAERNSREAVKQAEAPRPPDGTAAPPSR